jgi:hypothetical protein
LTVAYEVPTGPSPRTMAIDLAGTTYRLRLAYSDVDEGGWFMDLSDDAGTQLVCGVQLVVGADLLEQYGYLGVGGRLFVASDGDLTRPPGFADLGVTSHLYFEPFS